MYTWIGHALIPSFVGDLEHPEDFPKALAISMAFEFALFTITGAVVYNYAGQFSTAPGEQCNPCRTSFAELTSHHRPQVTVP